MKYLGTIATNASALTNLTTAAPFTIPASTSALRLQTAGADVYVVVGWVGNVAAASTTTAALLQSNVPLDVPLPQSTTAFVVSSYSAGSSSLRVLALLNW